MDFTPARNARLQPHDLARILGVNRQTCSMWLNDRCQPHRLLAERVAKLLDQIDRAVQVGLLPVPLHVTRRERGLYIQTALNSANPSD